MLAFLSTIINYLRGKEHLSIQLASETGKIRNKWDSRKEIIENTNETKS